MDVNGARLAVEFVAPDEIKQLVAGEDDVGMVGQGQQQVKLFGPQHDPLPGDGDFTTGRVNLDVADLPRFVAGGCG